MIFIDKLREKKNRIVTAGVMAVAEAENAADEAQKKPYSKTSRRAKKVLTSAVMGAIMAVMCSVPAFAAELDPSAFINEAVNALGIVVILIGGGIAIWGVVNLLEGYGNDNPGAKSQGMKQVMAN